MKKIVRKPCRHEAKFYKYVAAAGAVDVYKDDWPALEGLVQEGLLSWSPPHGMGKAFRKVSLPGHETW